MCCCWYCCWNALFFSKLFLFHFSTVVIKKHSCSTFLSLHSSLFRASNVFIKTSDKKKSTKWNNADKGKNASTWYYCWPLLAFCTILSEVKTFQKSWKSFVVTLWHYVHFPPFCSYSYIFNNFSLSRLRLRTGPKRSNKTLVDFFVQFCLFFSRSHLLYDLSLNIYLCIFTKLVNYLIVCTAKLVFFECLTVQVWKQTECKEIKRESKRKRKRKHESNERKRKRAFHKTTDWEDYWPSLSFHRNSSV